VPVTLAHVPCVMQHSQCTCARAMRPSQGSKPACARLWAFVEWGGAPVATLGCMLTTAAVHRALRQQWLQRAAADQHLLRVLCEVVLASAADGLRISVFVACPSCVRLAR
jgi:hypothetical protein